MQSDLDLHCQQKLFVSSSVVKELIIFQTPCYGCPFESSQDNSIEYPWQNLIYKSWYLKLHYSLLYGVNPFPNDKVLDETKFKAFADDKLNNKKNNIFVFDRIENILGTGENAGNQHFLLLPQCFQKPCFQEASKGVVGEWS